MRTWFIKDREREREGRRDGGRKGKNPFRLYAQPDPSKAVTVFLRHPLHTALLCAHLGQVTMLLSSECEDQRFYECLIGKEP